jgi:DHA2 family multidrug resistance protein
MEPTPPPAHDVEAMRRRYGARYKWLVLATVMVGTVGSYMSATIVNVAIPEISRHFGVGQERVQWISTAFMLAMTLSLPATAWLLQRYGLRRTYIAAVIVLAAGATTAAFSTTFGVLIIGRILEGAAAGVLQPIPNVVILRAFGQHEQGRAMGIFGMGIVFAPAIGPTVGGLLVESAGWRSIFFVALPFCAGALAMVFRYLPRISSLVGERRPFDWIGLASLSLAVLCLLNAAAELHAGAGVLACALAVLGAASLAGFIAYQLRTPAPLLELRLFARRSFAVGSIVFFLYGIGLFGSTYLYPVFMQMALDYSPSRAGLVLMPAGIVLGVVMPVAGRLADRFPPAPLVAAGLLLLSASIVLIAYVNPLSALVSLIAWAVVGRIGLGLVLPALSLGALRGLAPAQLPQAAGVTSFLRQLGGAIGVNLVGLVLEWRLAAHGAGAAHSGVHATDRVPAFQECLLVLAAIMLGAAIAAAFMGARRVLK